MSRRVLIGATLVVLVLLSVGVWLWRGQTTAIDLIEHFPEAEKRTTTDSLQVGFDIIDADLNGDRRRAIFAHASSRITWQIDVPKSAALETAIGLLPPAWTGEGNGAIFRIGVSDGTTYTEFFKQLVDPFNNEADRRWIPVTADLSRWGGTHVSLIFNVDANYGGNTANDLAVWGEPRIVTR